MAAQTPPIPPGFSTAPPPPAAGGAPPIPAGFSTTPPRQRASTPAPRRGGGRQPAPPRQPTPAAPAVDEYNEPLVVEAQRTAEGTTYLTRPLAEDETPEILTARGLTYDDATGIWRLPRELEDVETAAPPLEMLPMVRPPGGPLEQAAAAVADAYRSNPVGKRLLALASGGARGVQRVAGGAYGLLGQAADRLGLDGIGNAMIDQADAYQARANEMNAPSRRDDLFLNQTGQVAGEIAATAPVGMGTGMAIRGGGRALAGVAPRVGQVVERIGEATMSGGFLPSAVRPPAAGAAPVLAERLGNLATRGAGGAISGGTQAGLINEEDAAAGATIGALLPTVAARPAKYALNRLLEGWQVLSGTLGASRASEIVRRSLGIDYDAAVAALRGAGPDVTAQQALVDAGVEPSAFMGVGAAVRGAEPDAFLAIEARQAAARQAPIDRLAGGANLTAAQLSARGEKEAMRAATIPEGEAALARAAATGTLDVNAISQELLRRADTPGVRADPDQVTALGRVAQQLTNMADLNGGVIDPKDLYAIRQRFITNEVSRIVGQSNLELSAQRARIATLTAEIAPLIDDAIEAAGGSGWRQYLETYAGGMRSVERQNMMGVMGGLLRENPNAFARTVEGNAPDTVSGVFGGNRIDLANQMNPTGVGPSGMDALTDAARQIRRDERVGVLAGEGRGVAREMLQQGRGPFRHTRNVLTSGRPVTAAAMEFASMLVDAKVAPQIRRELARAYQSGANMDELLAMVPLATRAQMQRNMMNPAFWSHLTAAATNAMASPE